MENKNLRLFLNAFIYFSIAFIAAPNFAHAAPTAEDLSAAPTFDGNQYADPGSSAGTLAVGDYNCDGNKDVVIGAATYSGSKGRIYIKLGSASGFSGSTTMMGASFDVVITGSSSNQGLGTNLFFADIDSDGCEDLVSTASGAGNTDKILVFLSSTHLTGTANTIANADYTLATTAINGGYSTAHLLGALDGDVNSDGVTDDRDRYLALTNTGGSHHYLLPLSSITTATSIENAARYTLLGYDIANSISSGDLNSDGHEDLVIGDPYHASLDNVSIYFGPLSSSRSTYSDSTYSPSTVIFTGMVGGTDIAIMDDDNTISTFGGSVDVSSVTDTDQQDLIISQKSDTSSSGVSDAGSYTIITGESLAALQTSSGATAGIILYTDHTVRSGYYNLDNIDSVKFEGDAEDGMLGLVGNSNVHGDLNGDGQNDLVLGGNIYTNGTAYGRAYLIYGGSLQNDIGSTLELNNSDDVADGYFAGTEAGDAISSNVVTADVNADGLDDLFIAAGGVDTDSDGDSDGRLYIQYGSVTDLDGDGFDSARDSDGDGVYEPYDTNDKDATIHPGTYYQDADGDGMGNSSVSTEASELPAGYVTNGDDCDDTNASLTSLSTWYQDSDSDGLGNAAVSTSSCGAPSGYVATSGDCNDSDATVSVDSTLYQDADGDGFGDASTSTSSCGASVGYVADNTDINDADATIYPSAPELCDSIDNDGDGSVDEDVAYVTYYQDSDADGLGNSAVSTSSCSVPAGYVTNADDCDDADATATAGTWYADVDGDGFGDSSASVSTCSASAGYVADNTDCDDTSASVYPHASEIGDGVDNDCDDRIDENLLDVDLATLAPVDTTVTAVAPGSDFNVSVNVANNTGLATFDAEVWVSNDPVGARPGSHSAPAAISVIRSWAWGNSCLNSSACQQLGTTTTESITNDGSSQTLSYTATMPSDYVDGRYNVMVILRDPTSGQIIGSSEGLFSAMFRGPLDRGDARVNTTIAVAE